MSTQTLDTKPEVKENQAERDRLEAERWFAIFEHPQAEARDILKADFRLEEVLIFTESETVRTTYLARLFQLIAPARQKDQLERTEEFRAIHALLTAGEVLKHSAAGTRQRFAGELYQHSTAPSAVVSGIAHQKFTELLGGLEVKEKKALLAQVSNLLEASQ